MSFDLRKFVFSASMEEEEQPTPTPPKSPDEEAVENMLSSKLMNGFMLLDQPCPKCDIPLVRKPAPPSLLEECGDNTEPTTPRIISNMSMEDITTPIRGIPYCVNCDSFIVTNERERQLLEILKSCDDQSLAETYNSIDTRALMELVVPEGDKDTTADSGISFTSPINNWKRDDTSQLSPKSDRLGPQLTKELMEYATTPASQAGGVEMTLESPEGRDDESRAFWKEVEKKANGRDQPEDKRDEDPIWESVRNQYGITDDGYAMLNEQETFETLTDLGVISNDEDDREVEIKEYSDGEIEVQSPKKSSWKHSFSDSGDRDTETEQVKPVENETETEHCNNGEEEENEHWADQLLSLAKGNTAETEPSDTFDDQSENRSKEPATTENMKEKGEFEKNEVEMLMEMASSGSSEVVAALDKIEKAKAPLRSRKWKEDSNDESNAGSSRAEDSSTHEDVIKTDEPPSVEEDDVMKEYSAIREVATKVLGTKMLQGYQLKEIQCDQCGMPKMEYKSILHCVVCPILAKKAKKELRRIQKNTESGSTITIDQSIKCIQKNIESGSAITIDESMKTKEDIPSQSLKSCRSAEKKIAEEAEKNFQQKQKEAEQAKEEEVRVKKQYEKAKEEKKRKDKNKKEEISRTTDSNDNDSVCVASLAPGDIKSADARRKRLEAKEKKLLEAASTAEEEAKEFNDKDISTDDKKKRRADVARAEEMRNDQLRLIKETKRLETMERMRLANELEFHSPQESTLAIFALQEERKRLRNEAIRQKEMRAREKEDREAELEARRIVDQKRGAQEAEMIEVLEKEAQRKAKEAEEAIAQARAAMEEVNSAKRLLLAQTIAQGEADTVAEAEAIVRAEAEDYHQEHVVPSASFLWRERWETLRLEGRSVMTRRLIAGWSMLSEYCTGTECQNTPLLSKGDKVECVVCGGNGTGKDGAYYIPVEDDEDDNQSDSHPSPPVSPDKAKSAVLTDDAANVSTVQALQQIHDDFEEKRTMVSKEIGKKMLQGWTLLDMSCPNCVMPLLTDEEGKNGICVLCGVVGKISEDQMDRNHQASTKESGTKAAEVGSPKKAVTVSNCLQPYNRCDGAGEQTVNTTMQTVNYMATGNHAIESTAPTRYNTRALAKSSMFQIPCNISTYETEDVCNYVVSDYMDTSISFDTRKDSNGLPPHNQKTLVELLNHLEDTPDSNCDMAIPFENLANNSSTGYDKESAESRHDEQELYFSTSDCPTDEFTADSMAPIADYFVEGPEISDPKSKDFKRKKSAELALEKINARRASSGREPLIKELINETKAEELTNETKAERVCRSFSAKRNMMKSLTVDTSGMNNSEGPSPETPKTPKTLKTPKARGSGRRSSLLSPKHSSPSPSPRRMYIKAVESPNAANYETLAARLRSLLADTKSPRGSSHARSVHSAPSSPCMRNTEEFSDYLINSISERQSRRSLLRHEDPPAMTASALRDTIDPDYGKLSPMCSPRGMVTSKTLISPRSHNSPRTIMSPTSTKSPRPFIFPDSPSGLSRIRRSFDDADGMTLVIPNDFDVTDDVQLRELILAAKGRKNRPVQAQIVNKQGGTEIIDLIDMELPEVKHEEAGPRTYSSSTSSDSRQSLSRRDTIRRKSEARRRLKIRTATKAAGPAKSTIHAPSPGEGEAKRLSTSFRSSPNHGSDVRSHHHANKPTSRKTRPTPESLDRPRPESTQNRSPIRSGDSVKPQAASAMAVYDRFQNDGNSPRSFNTKDRSASSINPDEVRPRQFFGSRNSESHTNNEGAKSADINKIFFTQSSSNHSRYNDAEPSLTIYDTGLPPISPRKRSRGGDSVVSSNSSGDATNVGGDHAVVANENNDVYTARATIASAHGRSGASQSSASSTAAKPKEESSHKRRGNDGTSLQSVDFGDILGRIDSWKLKLGKSSSAQRRERHSTKNLEMLGKFTAAAIDVETVSNTDNSSIEDDDNLNS